MAQPHHFPRVTHYHVRVYDRRAVLWIGATNKTKIMEETSRASAGNRYQTSILMIRVHENISSYLSFLLSFSFDVSVFVEHCNFFFLSTESSLTCCRESCPASRRDCKEHESLGSPRTPRRSISGDGPSKSVSPSNWSSVSDSSRPANEKSPRFIEKNPPRRKIYLDDERTILVETIRETNLRKLSPRCAAPFLPFVLGIPD